MFHGGYMETKEQLKERMRKTGLMAKGHAKPNSRKSGKTSGKDGYVHVNLYLLTDEEKKLFPDLGKRHTVLEHRLIVSKILGRPLEPGEVVRHRDGNMSNNDVDNLVLGSSKDNSQDHVQLAIKVALWREMALMFFFILANQRA
jgi:hypothetical protein